MNPRSVVGVQHRVLARFARMLFHPPLFKEESSITLSKSSVMMVGAQHTRKYHEYLVLCPYKRNPPFLDRFK